MNLLRLIWDEFWRRWRVETRGMVGIAGISFAQIAVSLAISAISYGIQALLAPKPPTIKGPRKGDLAAPLSDIGSPIPFAVGRNLARGQIIWSSGLVETKTTSSQKVGKGGGKKQKTETYTYSVSVAVAFNDGEVACVRRILANGSKVIYSERFGTEWTDAAIDAEVQAKYDEVYAAQITYWTAITDGNGSPLYTSEQVIQTAEANATAESEALRSELENIQSDSTPRFDQIEFFYGTETQNPSSIIEGFEGAGNVPAYRGTAYLVIQNLQLADFGNSMPILEIDVGARTSADAVTGGTPATFNAEDYTLTDGGNHTNFNKLETGIVDHTRGLGYMPVSAQQGTAVAQYSVIDLSTMSETKLLNASDYGYDALELSGADGLFFYGVDPSTGYLIGGHGANVGQPHRYIIDPVNEVQIAHVQDANGNDFISREWPVAILGGSSVAGRQIVVTDDQKYYIFKFSDLAKVGEDTISGTSGSNPSRNTIDGTVCFGSASNGGTTYNVHKLTYAGPASMPTEAINGFSVTSISAGATWTTPTNNFRYCEYLDAYLDQSDATSGEYIIAVTGAGALLWAYEMPFTENLFWMCNQQGHNITGRLYPLVLTASDIYWIDLDDGSLVSTTDLTSATWLINPADEDWDPTDAYWWDGDTCTLYTRGENFSPNVTKSRKAVFNTACGGTAACDDPMTLMQVITKYMERAGYSSGEYSIDSALANETIYGLNDNSGRTSREVLEDLAKIRPVGAYESEGLVKFTYLDQSTAIVIPVADVRAYDGNSSAPDWLAEVTTLEDKALPRFLQITYRDHERLINKTSVSFKREITQGTDREEFEVEAVDTAANMRTSVINAASQMMTTRQTVTLTLPQKYMALEPGDLVTVPVSDANTVTLRLTKVERGANGIIEATGVINIEQTSTSLASKYGASITTVSDYTEISTDTAGSIGSSRVHIIDTPYLTDAAELDANNAEDKGLYVAVSNDGAAGAASVYVDNVTLQTVGVEGVYSQLTGEPEWVKQLDFTSFVDDGYYVRGLNPDAAGYVLDTASELVVTFRNSAASFSSLSEITSFASQDNVFLIGNEIIQARTATLIGTSATTGNKTYKFTNLWRGLQGTEWAISEMPAALDKVIHLNPNGLQRFDTENLNLVGFNIGYRVVTIGQDVTGVSTTSAPFVHRSAQPYAPTVTEIDRDGDGNLTFQLVQRSRYGHDWGDNTADFNSDGTDFEIDIISAGSPTAVVRTLTSSGTEDPVITYTAAQQSTDFGSAQAQVTIRPYQLNSAGRRGFTNEEVI